MFKSPLLPPALIGTVIAALLVMAFGGYLYLTSTQRFDELSKIQPSSQDLTQIPEAEAVMLSQVALDRRAADQQRGQGIVFFGGGVLLLGVAGLIFSRLPDVPQKTGRERA